jgi:hypothetical protein
MNQNMDAENQRMTQRAFRIPDDLWERVKQKADRTKTPVSVIVRQLLLAWVENRFDPTEEELKKNR